MTKPLAVLALFVTLAGEVSGATDPSPIPALSRAFDTHAIVQLGELHRGLQTHAFIQQLLRDPRFICRADDVVMEFGNSRLQRLADAYTAGAALSEAQIASMWRETSVPFTWNTPVYRAVYDTVRDIDRLHLCAHPVRLVLADAPLDWSKIKTAKDLLPFADRDAAMADTIEREVIARHHHAFFISGEFHAEKKTGDDADGLTTAQIVERRHPGSVFAVVTVTSAEAAAVLRMGPSPSFKAARDTDIAPEPFAMTKPGWSANAPKAAHGLAIGEVVDGVLWLGGDSSLYPSPAIYLDPGYQKELRRRLRIIDAVSGQDFLAVLDDLVREARDQDALAHPK
ncbi:MAG: hypothetical protein JO261_11080 [Alphaproteobacteria bacterium]|nr:hypothetical protein [Alphaproteobacteria bacterium]MBV9694230.1 hypothetical protein [Alphaproteobacteria bacterium]